MADEENPSESHEPLQCDCGSLCRMFRKNGYPDDFVAICRRAGCGRSYAKGRVGRDLLMQFYRETKDEGTKLLWDRLGDPN